MNEHFVGLKSCLPSSTSSNDKARIRIGHFEMGLSCVLWADFQPFSCVTSKKQMKEERPFPKRSHSAVRHKTNPVTRATLKWPIPKKENKKRGETGRRKERGGGGEEGGGVETLLPCIFYNQAAASQKEQKPQLQKQNTHN